VFKVGKEEMTIAKGDKKVAMMRIWLESNELEFAF